MENRNDKNHNNNGNGFLLGLVLGSVATLLFTTKKGREIVKEVTEIALDKFSNFEKNLNQKVENYEEVIESDYIEPVDRPEQLKENEKSKLLAKEVKTEKNREEKKEVVPMPKPQRPVRRFFRNKS